MVSTNKLTANYSCYVIFIKKYFKRKCEFLKNVISLVKLLYSCHPGNQVSTYYNFSPNFYEDVFHTTPANGSPEITCMKGRKLCLVCINYFSQQTKWLFETACTLVERDCVKFHLIFTLMEKNQARSSGIL